MTQISVNWAYIMH